MVLSYVDVLLRGKPVGKSVAVVGAGGIGFDVAEFLVHGERPAEERGRTWRAGWRSGASPTPRSPRAA